MSWNGTNETLRKSLVSWKLSIIQRLVDWERRKLDTYSCKYLNFGHSITQAFFKKWKNSHFESWPNSPVSHHRVVWISYSRLYFVRWLNLRGVSYSGGTALWSWWSSLFQKAEVVRWCCTWSWTCLAALDDFDVVCVQKWTKLSHGAPVQLLSLILGLSSAWWRIGSRRNIRLCCLSLQSSSLPPTLDALSMHVRRANYQAAIWRRARHPGSSLPGPHGYGWLCKPECGDDPASHSSVEIQWMTQSCCPTGFVGPGQVRLHFGLLHTAL